MRDVLRVRPLPAAIIQRMSHDTEAWRAAAERYLAQQLGERRPGEMRLEAGFEGGAPETGGAAAVFSFELPPPPSAAPCSPADLRHYVVAGETEPNYYPAYGLDADDAYSVHVGTRFMLEVEVQRIADEQEPPQARESLLGLLAQYAPGIEPEAIELAALFTCDDEPWAIYRVEIAGRSLYAMGAACPPGFYELTAYPPQAALRLHLGKLIRHEAEAERAQEGDLPTG